MPPQRIMMDYDKLPIRCRACLSWKNKASECGMFQKRPMGGRPTYARNNQPQHEKGKNLVVDEDGFQHVISKKNMRRNIFKKKYSMGGIQQTTCGQAEEQSKAREELQAVAEDLETPTEPLGGQGTFEATTELIRSLELISNCRRNESIPNSG